MRHLRRQKNPLQRQAPMIPIRSHTLLCTGAGYYNTADLEDVKAQSKKNALNINYEGRRDQEEEISGPAHRPFRTGTAAAAKELSDCIKGVGTDVIARCN